MSDIHTTVDAKGLSCPMPIVKTAQAVKNVPAGELIEVLATDPGSVKDFAAWTRSTGNAIVEQTEDGGVYRFVRHPMYAAHLLWAVAQVLLIPNWITGPAMLVFFVPMYLVRVPREERMMLEHFGDAYRRYRARTGAVLPRFTAWRSGAPPD